ncbi:formate hydrogenlyase subunit 7 [mine drainage metagenome]|uniref:Formate hydrogenlyase subunit 7 n=1 Tax=mine drainage metagenome TaxID=410659 RepID=A0A1J5S496_9ZZZZ
MRLVRLLLKTLLKGPVTLAPPPADADSLAQLAQGLAARSRAVLGRSLAIRALDAGSCNGCELELQAVGGPVYDLERYGLKFVASPRHADVLLVTGPVTRNMALAARRTFEAMAAPKWVVAVGDCARDGGCFAGSYAVMNGVQEILPVDLVIPGCPPEPQKLLAALLALLETVA